MARTPIYIITGFLGSGKTTLLRQIISSNSDLRVAIIQNDFSDEMGIEAPTMVDRDGNIFKEFFELPNGCVCCTVKDELLRAVEYLLRNKELDKILLETTGVADPEPIIEKFWLDSELETSISLSGVITVVDCFNFGRSIDPSTVNDICGNRGNSGSENEQNQLLSSEIIKQIMLANKIILNKTDLLGSCSSGGNRNLSIGDIEGVVRRINPSASIKSTSRSDVDMHWLFNMDAYNIGKVRSEMDETLSNIAMTSHSDKSILPSISSVVFSFSSVNFSHKLIEKVIASIAWNDENGEALSKHIGKLIRYKGLFSSKSQDDNSADWHALQGVGEVFEVLPVNVPSNEPIECSKFFFLGTNLDGDEIKRLIESCII